MKQYISNSPRAKGDGRVLNLKKGQVYRKNTYWYAMPWHLFLSRPKVFLDLGSALSYLGYNQVSVNNKQKA